MMMEQFVNSVVQAHRDGVSLQALDHLLGAYGMEEEERAILLDIVKLEVNQK
jgi:hypothetical protein